MTARDDGRGGRVLSRRGTSSPLQAAGEEPLIAPFARDAAVIWHDVECGGYAADLPLWEELADDAVGPILDLGCGTGRVALHLARRGHRVLGVDAEASFVEALSERAGELPVEAEVGDARDFELGVEFGLVLAPMQLLQLFLDPADRVACLSCVASHLGPGGMFACAIVERMTGGSNRAPDGSLAPGVVPDAREIEGWVYSSLPLEAEVGDEEMVIRRLRQIVSPTGELIEEVDDVRLRTLDAGTLEREAEAAGLRRAGRRDVPATDEHAGSTVALFERAA